MLKEELAGVWSFEAVEQRLVDAMHLWRRSPGGGRWPFASDGPWHLASREVYGPDVDKDAPVQPSPLTRAEIAERDQASEWLRLVNEADRRIVVLALLDQAAGRRVSWLRMRAKVGVKLGADGLRRRYSKAITTIAKHLNASGVRMAA